MESAEPLIVDPSLPTTSRKREAEDWALVLQAEGRAVAVVRVDQRFTVAVPADEVAEAGASLRAWQVERATPRPPDLLAPFALPSTTEIALSIASAASLVAFHLGLVRARRHAALIEEGESQAALVMLGEVERSLTALTLHSDLPHVLGNALFGAFFLALLSGRVGFGIALACFFATGTLGNLANALYYGHTHSSIGASTGVFGLVGVSAGLAAWRRHRLGTRNRGAWVALGAGLAIVAMLGGAGPKIDLTAHLFGLAAGSLSGLALAYPLARVDRPRPATQLSAAGAALAALALAWRIASATP
jgi:rhomboid protease GluP